MDTQVKPAEPVIDRMQRAVVHQPVVTEHGRPNFKLAIKSLADLVAKRIERNERT